jgi:hypothetical protein
MYQVLPWLLRLYDTAGPVLAVRKMDTVGVDVGSRKVSVGVPFRKA